MDPKPEDQDLPSSDAETRPQDPGPQDQAATGDGTTPAPDEPPKPLPDPTEADLKKLRPETRKRFEQLLAQRNEARQTIDSWTPELQQWRQMQDALQRNQLAPEDVNTLLGVGAVLRRGDYQGFLDGVMPYVMAAQEALGIRVSPDLQTQVDEGVIDENAARELTRTRHRALQAEARLHEHSQVATQTQQAQHVGQIRSAVDNWEANIRQRDPDYARMSDVVRRVAQGLLQERGSPQNQQEAVALVEAAYGEAKAAFARAQPAPRPTRNGPSGIHVATGSQGANPRNLKEAVMMALAATRRAS